MYWRWDTRVEDASQNVISRQENNNILKLFEISD
jgi:hypothetical protein